MMEAGDDLLASRHGQKIKENGGQQMPRHAGHSCRAHCFELEGDLSGNNIIIWSLQYDEAKLGSLCSVGVESYSD